MKTACIQSEIIRPDADATVIFGVLRELYREWVVANPFTQSFTDWVSDHYGIELLTSLVTTTYMSYKVVDNRKYILFQLKFGLG